MILRRYMVMVLMDRICSPLVVPKTVRGGLWYVIDWEGTCRVMTSFVL